MEIQNSLNKGIYTEIKTREALSVDDVSKIEDKMRELVQADIPFVRKILSREEAFKLFSDHNHEEQRRILKGLPHVDKVPVYSCDGFLNFFYGQMVPSTGYIEYFELRRYRNGVILRFPSRLRLTGFPNSEMKQSSTGLSGSKNGEISWESPMLRISIKLLQPESIKKSFRYPKPSMKRKLLI